MKKVVLLSGSPNAKGNTMQVLNKMAEAIESKGVNAEVISMAGINVADCMAPSVLKEKDGLNEIIEKIKVADGLIIGGPVYWGTMRGQFMSTLQRIAQASAGDGNFLKGMVGGPVVIGRRGGHTSALQESLMFYLYHDMIVVGSTYWNIVFGRSPGEAVNDIEGMKTVLHFAENVADLVNKL